MSKWIYNKWIKTALIAIQLIAVGVLTYCLLNVGFWTEGNYSFREMSKSYEETDLFFRQVDAVISNKIRGQQNNELFERNGELDLSREIDIQSYGISVSSVQDMNTTYLLSNLIEFGENGGRKRLHEAIENAVERQGEQGREAGERLDEQSDSLETILPVTGISLSECSRWYSKSADFVLNMYIRLDEVSEDIYGRYIEYTTTQEESWSAGAPSNLRYCIENTANGELYTNIDAENYESAVRTIVKDEDFLSLYEGERSFNIMVTNPDNLLNQSAANWFMDERFIGSNEKVFLAVDPTYPVSDELKQYAEIFSSRGKIVEVSFAGAAVFGDRKSVV